MVVCGRVGALERKRVANMAGYRSAGAVVAALLDPAGEVLDGRRPGIEGDGGRLRDGVRLDVEDARPVPEHALDDGLLGRVVQTADVQRRCARA